ncbi:hypothetical protein ANANG_G00312580 [Anguilla anguilla]|uniref:Uncharacterized protein n=1 Tax=Anguilla anguilla TaxID=7936 RepID=A0A9D3LIP0_ANGAN|nr:hypothetical protein ANANG_G00312580 [Anguilla anguilla]
MALHGVLPAGMEKEHMQLPKGMSRTKSFGSTEEDRLSALAGEPRFPRSSSMTDSLREGQSIPPPPQIAPPSSPSPYFLDTGPPRPSARPLRRAGPGPDALQLQAGAEARVHGLMAAAGAGRGGGGGRGDGFARALAHAERQKKARSMIILQDSAHLPVEPTDIPRPGPASTPPEKLKRKGRVIDNPYANVGQFSMGLYTPAKPQRKKSPLVKQLQVEDAQERAALASAHARDLSPTGRLPHLSRAADFYAQQLLQERARPPGRALRRRHRRGGAGPREAAAGRQEVHGLPVGGRGRERAAGGEAPSLTQSRSVDERLLTRASLARCPAGPGAAALARRHHLHPPAHREAPGPQLAAGACAGRQGAGADVPEPVPCQQPEPRAKHERAGPLFARPHTKEAERPETEGGLGAAPFSRRPREASSPSRAPRPPKRSGAPRPAPQRGGGAAERKAEDRKGVVMSIVDTSQQKTAGLIVVHAMSNGQAEEAEPSASPTGHGPPDTPTPRPWSPQPALPEAARGPSRAPRPRPTQPRPRRRPPAPREKTLAQGSSEEDFANGLQARAADAPARSQPNRPPRHSPSPQPPPPPPAAAAAAAAQPPPAGGAPSGKATDATPPTPESAADSGVEEADTRSSSDHHLETTSTVSTVSSMSTLSSESGEPTDTYTSYADGQTFILDKPPVPPKPKLKSQLGKGPVTFRDPLLKQSSDSELLPQQHAAAAGRPRYLFQRRSKLWGDPLEARPAPGPEDGKPTVIGELSSRLQQLNKDTRSLGEEPLGASLDPGRKSPVSGARCDKENEDSNP